MTNVHCVQPIRGRDLCNALYQTLGLGLGSCNQCTLCTGNQRPGFETRDQINDVIIYKLSTANQRAVFMSRDQQQPIRNRHLGHVIMTSSMTSQKWLKSGKSILLTYP